MDDILVASKSVDSHTKTLAQIFSKIEENTIKLNLDTCCFLKSEVRFLGQILSEGTVRADLTKFNEPRLEKEPHTKK